MKRNELRETAVSLISGVIAGVVFLLLLFALKWNFFIDIVLALGVYLGLDLVLKPRRRIGGISIEDIPNGEELEKRLNEAREDFRAIEASMERIEDFRVKQDAEKLNQTAGRIIAFLEDHPEKIRLARQFIDYYQETASSLLGKYVELQDTKLGTEEVQKLQTDTVKALGTLNIAFEQQFQKLMKNEMLDMDAEIRLLEQTVKTENWNQ